MKNLVVMLTMAVLIVLVCGCQQPEMRATTMPTPTVATPAPTPRVKTKTHLFFNMWNVPGIITTETVFTRYKDQDGLPLQAVRSFFCALLNKSVAIRNVIWNTIFRGYSEKLNLGA